MLNYILRRLLLIIPTLFGIMVVNFVIVQAAPGGPVERMIAEIKGTASDATARISGAGGMETKDRGRAQGVTGLASKYRGARGLDPELIKELERLYGFDKPAPERFFHMMKNYVRFDFGDSYFRDRSVFDLVVEICRVEQHSRERLKIIGSCERMEILGQELRAFQPHGLNGEPLPLKPLGEQQHLRGAARTFWTFKNQELSVEDLVNGLGQKVLAVGLQRRGQRIRSPLREGRRSLHSRHPQSRPLRGLRQSGIPHAQRRPPRQRGPGL